VDPHIQLPGLLRVPCELSGSWTSAERASWTARASCEHAVVCMSLIVSDGTAHWSKSTRLTPESDAVRVGLGFDPADAAHVVIGCGSIGLPTRLAQAGARPALADLLAIETGVLWRLCRFDSQPAVGIFVLFLAAPDVQWGRNKLWRLRLPKAEAVGEPLRSALIGGRSGEYAWPTDSHED
jgi:hypothetical protein